MSSSTPTVYGVTSPVCPGVPQGNIHLLEYIRRMKNCMSQLAMEKNKVVTMERLTILINEVKTVNGI